MNIDSVGDVVVIFLMLGGCFVLLLMPSVVFLFYWQSEEARGIQSFWKRVAFVLDKTVQRLDAKQAAKEAEEENSIGVSSLQTSRPQTASPPETKTSPQARIETPTTVLLPLDLSSNEFLLLVLTWLLEIPGALARVILFLVIIFFLLLALGIFFVGVGFVNFRWGLAIDRAVSQVSPLFSLLVMVVVFLLSFGNLVISVVTAFGFIPVGLSGGTFTRFSMGARKPSKRELETVRNAFEQIQENVSQRTLKRIKGPHHWFVLDSPLLAAHPIGATLYLTRGLINSPHLVAVLAHNLGHFNAPDARLTLALRRLLLPPVFLFNQTTAGLFVAPAMSATQQEGTGLPSLPHPVMMYVFGIVLYILLLMLSIAGGGLGLLLLGPLWIWHFRERDYAADHFAARCGLAQELIEYLEAHQFFDAAVPYFLSVQPYTELRIDKLLTYLERQG